MRHSFWVTVRETHMQILQSLRPAPLKEVTQVDRVFVGAELSLDRFKVGQVLLQQGRLEVVRQAVPVVHGHPF